MRVKTAKKCLEILQNVEDYPNQALKAKLDFVKSHIEQEIVSCEIRANAIKNSKELKGGKNERE